MHPTPSICTYVHMEWMHVGVHVDVPHPLAGGRP